MNELGIIQSTCIGCGPKIYTMGKEGKIICELSEKDNDIAERIVTCFNLCVDMDDPEKEIEELRRDAERYRKLRKHDTVYTGDEAFPKSAESYDKWVDGELL